MKSYTYLLIDFTTVVACFIFSFHKRIQFYRHFRSFFNAAILVGIPFIAWDIWFAAKGVWWFNEKYTLGLFIFGLPLEEWLFFICIPFSCVFTFYCLDKFFDLRKADKYSGIITGLMLIVSITVALLFRSRIYPFVTALILAGSFIYLYFIAEVRWIGRASLVYLLLMMGFFPVNGILTGMALRSPIVNYNPNMILGIRVLTIPVEDFFYGYVQFLLNVYCFMLFKGDRQLQKMHS
ncbi:MAG: lycopene cyclase domain-containing protein [Bacteroidetes bacterium]|nr:MAG: lycopene cyclase domain-containing protein [Bacteroidota bacterium]